MQELKKVLKEDDSCPKYQMSLMIVSAMKKKHRICEYIGVWDKSFLKGCHLIRNLKDEQVWAIYRVQQGMFLAEEREMWRTRGEEKFNRLGTKRRPVLGNERDSEWHQLQEGMWVNRSHFSTLPLLFYFSSSTNSLPQRMWSDFTKLNQTLKIKTMKKSRE